MINKGLILVFLTFTSFTAKSQTIDQKLLTYCTKNVTKNEYSNYRNISRSAFVLAAGIPVVQWSVYLKNKNQSNFNKAVITTGSLIINTGFTWGLKYAFNRSRPNIIFPFQTHKPSDPSFPSGHTSYSFALATSLTLEYKKWYVALPAYAWAGAVGFSRLKTGVHYPTDVLGGALIGVGSAFLSYKINDWLQNKAISNTERKN